MGTHPIFESDFDCLTEMLGRPSSILARRVVLTSQPVTKRNAGYKSWLDVLEYHGSNYAEVRFWQKINFYFAQVMTAISLWIGAHLRHPHSIDRDPWNPAPWLNNNDVEQPFGKNPCWFYNPAMNYRPGKGFDDVATMESRKSAVVPSSLNTFTQDSPGKIHQQNQNKQTPLFISEYHSPLYYP